MLRPAYVTAVGPRIKVTGQLTATEHVIIEGVFEGEIAMPDHGLAISGAAHACVATYAPASSPCWAAWKAT